MISGCPKATTPSSNVDFWLEKFQLNTERDVRNMDLLVDTGWRVGVVWECVIGREPSSDLMDQLHEFIIRGQEAKVFFE